VRLIIGANLSPRVAARLRGAGHDAVHVADIGMLAAADEAILAHAAGAGQVIISADTDFGELLAVSGATRPSVVLLRSADHLTPDQQATLLIANLPAVAADLESGAAVSIARGRLRVRPLPVRPAPDRRGRDTTGNAT
jgi:predicted nuclease of predicted toxin-antitoxin system